MRGSGPGSAAFAPEAPDGHRAGWGVVSLLTRIAEGGEGHMGTARKVSPTVLGGELGTEGAYVRVYEGAQSRPSQGM